MIILIPFFLVLFSFTIIKVWDFKRKYNLLISSNECKDRIIEENRKIRHEYNNMLQTLICYIEEGDINQLNQYKTELLKNVQSFNQNNIVQLSRISDTFIMTSVFELLVHAQTNNNTLNLTVYEDILRKYQLQDTFNIELPEYLQCAYECAAKINSTTNVKVNFSEFGVNFSFESLSETGKDDIITIDTNKIMTKRCKNIFYNTFLKDSKIVQEVILSYK